MAEDAVSKLVRAASKRYLDASVVRSSDEAWGRADAALDKDVRELLQVSLNRAGVAEAKAAALQEWRDKMLAQAWERGL